MRLTYGMALRQALHDSLKSDPSTFLFGEDIQKNVYGYTGGLAEEFGEERVRNIPLSEAGAVGIACGAAMCGLRPILDLTIPNFLYVAMDQIANMAAKVHYMSNGAYSLPLTVLCTAMSGSGNAAQHSDRVHALFQNIHGLKIICPATPQDMYSMMREGIEDNSPVLCLADRFLFWTEEEVVLETGNSIGRSRQVTVGKDVTVVTVSSCLQMVKEILPDIEKAGIQAEVIDIRSVVPLDMEPILDSVKKTGRVVICDTAGRTGSAASEIAARLAQDAFYDLRAPIQIAAGEDSPVPFTKLLEEEVLVTKEKILQKIFLTLDHNKQLI